MADCDYTARSRVCTKCGVDKALGEFHRDKLGKYGRVASCKACCKQYYQARFARDRDAINAASLAAYHRKHEPKRIAKKAAIAQRLECPVKHCTKCGTTKPKSEFGKDKHRIDGLRPWCKECRREETKEWRASNPEKSKSASESWKKRNPEKVAARMRRWHKENKGRCSQNAKEWKAKNRDKVKNIDDRHRSRPEIRAHRAVSSRIRQSLLDGKGGNKTFEILGYTRKDLAFHLERQFSRGMSWSNYGEWHIDHVVPASSFNFTSMDDPEFKACWALTNLRPLWAKDNLTKHAKRTHLL